jgi:hypothetical protein
MTCQEVKHRLPGYLDGATRSRDHAHVRQHLESCEVCREELEDYRRLSIALGRMEPVAPPPELAARIQVRVSQELAERGRSTRLWSRARLAFENILEPLAVPATGGVLTALLVFVLVAQNLLGGIPYGSVPNDLPTSLFQPARLESLAPFPAPGIGAGESHPGSAGVLVLEATLDAQGNVVSYSILSGPDDSAVRRQIDQILLFSRFRPQLDFGRPTAGGRVMLVFSEVRVRG